MTTPIAHAMHMAAQPQTTVALLAAGIVPEMFDLNHLLGGVQVIYFALLIPVAIGHLLTWGGEQWKKFNKREIRIEKKLDDIKDKLEE